MRASPLVSSLPLLALLAFAAACGDDSAASSSSGSGGGDTGSGGAGPSGSGGGATSGPGVTSGPGSGGGTTTSSGGGSTSTGEGAGSPCAEGTIVCEGATKRVCDGNGGFTDEEACAPGVCIPGVGCTECAPGSGTCEGNVSTVCNADGMGFTSYTCDPEQGVTCDAGTGHCVGACSPELIGTSYIGCDYYPTVSIQLVPESFSFAVAVANTSDEQSTVKIHQGANLIVDDVVAPNSVRIFELPWVGALRNAGSTALVPDGAYRLRTSQPVTVYQYSPIEYFDGGFGYSYTNDASLLLPTNAWTGNYRVVSRNHWNFSGFSYPGFYSVVATQDATTVTLSPSATGTVVNDAGGLVPGGAGTVVLNDGDVLQVLTGSTGGQPDPSDLTGTLVSADKPVQVMGGHQCTFVPYNIWACDHLEEVMYPLETLATEYIVTPPLIPTGGATPKAQMVRVVATQPNTSITYDPPQAGAPALLANPGDYFEIPETLADFVISADQPISVAQYMLGQDYGGGSGDPAMALAVSTEQYREEYLFHAPTNYEANYVNVTAPAGATITLDGVAVGGFVPIGASGYGIARVPLSNAGDGNHVMIGDQPFGISVYGYGQYTSYWYPGGLDLDKVSTQ